MTEQEKPESSIHDLFEVMFGVFALGLLINIKSLVDTSGPAPFYKGPLIFPLFVLCLIFIGSLPSIYRLVRNANKFSWYLDGEGFPVRTLFVFVLLIFYFWILVYAGLEISSWLFLFFSLFLLGQRSIFRLIAIPTLTTLIVYFLFKYFLDIWFPTPVLMEIFLG